MSFTYRQISYNHIFAGNYHFKSTTSAVAKISFKLGELFCGPGGIGCGVELACASPDLDAEIKHIWANDIDPAACKTYKGHFKGAIVVNSDAHAFVDEVVAGNFSKIDALTFGFPCNDFSIVGEKKGLNGKYGPLYRCGIAILENVGPKWFLAENVSGITNANQKSAFKKIVEDMRKAGPGYKLVIHQYKFEDYGVPQARHRMIIVGIRLDLYEKGICFKVPAPSGKRTNAGQALANIPKSATNQELTRQSPTVVERLKHIKPGQNVWNADLPKHLKLNVKGAKLSQIYKRLDAKKPAYTITGSGGGGTHVYHWSENRSLTNRERARLQTFPDDYVFHGSKEQVRKQIGMAVPPMGVAIIISAIVKTFQEKSYKSVDASIEE
jgi:DNA (cytosine-5)-methyltransferase 1